MSSARAHHASEPFDLEVLAMEGPATSIAGSSGMRSTIGVGWARSVDAGGGMELTRISTSSPSTPTPSFASVRTAGALKMVAFASETPFP